MVLAYVSTVPQAITAHRSAPKSSIPTATLPPSVSVFHLAPAQRSDTCAAASAADKGLAHLLLDRTGPRDLSVVGNLAVRALDSGSLPLLICPPPNNDLAAQSRAVLVAPGLPPTASSNVDDSTNDNYDPLSSHRRGDARGTQPGAISSHPLPLNPKDADDASPPRTSITTPDPLIELWLYAASLSDDDTCDTTDPVHRRDAFSSTMEACPDPTIVVLPRLRPTATIDESSSPTHDESLNPDTMDDSDSDVWSDALSDLPPDGDSDTQSNVPAGDDEVVLSDYGPLPRRCFHEGIDMCPSCKPFLNRLDQDIDLQPQLAALPGIDLTLAPPPPAAQTDTTQASPCTGSASADPDIPIPKRPLCVRDLAVHLVSSVDCPYPIPIVMRMPRHPGVGRSLERRYARLLALFFNHLPPDET